MSSSLLAPVTAAPLKVSAQWLADAIEAGAVRVVDTRASAEYLSGHVSGAVNFALNALLIEDSSEAALDALAHAARCALAARGISIDDHVVVVDALDGSAALGLAVLELAGVARVSLLGGGVVSWRAAGHELEHLPAPITRRTDAPTSVDDARSEPRHIASFEQVVAAATTGSARLIDVRSQLEHEGIVGSPCCPTRGHVPTSLHLEWTALIDHAGRLHSPERTSQMARHIGIDVDDEVIVYCHSAHRAAVASLALRAAGFSHVRLALGSWHEWSTRRLASDGQIDR